MAQHWLLLLRRGNVMFAITCASSTSQRLTLRVGAGQGVNVDAKDGMRLAEVLRRRRRGVLGVETGGGARGDGCRRQRSERLQPRILWAFVFDVLLGAL